MTKNEFSAALREALFGWPEADVARTLEYYEEMIDDRIEDGMPEEEAVAAMGSIGDILNTVAADAPLPTLVKARVKPRRPLRAWEVVLLILGSPLWLTFLLAALCLVLAGYAVLWALIITLWAVAAALLVCGGAMIVPTVVYAVQGNLPAVIFAIGCGAVLCGVGLLLGVAARFTTKGCAALMRVTGRGIKRLFVRKDGVPA